MNLSHEGMLEIMARQQWPPFWWRAWSNTNMKWIGQTDTSRDFFTINTDAFFFGMIGGITTTNGGKITEKE